MSLQPERRRENFLVFGSPLIGEEEIEEVVATLRSGWIGTGPRVAQFQQDFGKYVGADYALAVNSCTAGLHLAMLVSGVGPGDEVITTPMTFCATANAIVHTGAKPVFADVDRNTMLIDPNAIEAAITPATRAIVPVHLAGRPCDMDRIGEIARRHNLLVIEDAAHCIEGWYHGQKIGSISDLTCFSFYVTKNIVTGEGGMITTRNEEWANKIKCLALHGMTKDAWNRFSDSGYKHYRVADAGFKYNMMDIQAALGLHQLKRVEKCLTRRCEIWSRYEEAFAGLPVFLPEPEEPDTVHARHLFTLMVDTDRCTKSRDEIMNDLSQWNIGTGVHYTALHLHPFYQDTFGCRQGQFPNTEWIGDRTLSLPLSAKLTDEDVEDVIAAVRYVVGSAVREPAVLPVSESLK